MLRILIAGLIGGIIVFAWGAISHMMTPLGEMGVKQLPAEEQIAAAIKSHVTESGFYFLPGADKSAPQNMEAVEARYKAGPRGVLILHPQPTDEDMMSPKKLGAEFISNVLAAIVAAMIVTLIAGAMITRVFVVAMLALFGWLSLSISHWNWYGYPTDYIVAELAIELIGWFAAGIPIALIVPKPKVRVPTA